MYSIDYITSIEYLIAKHKVVKFVDYSIIPPSEKSTSHTPNSWNPESAHSSVMGVLMLIAIVMIMGGVVAFVFTSQPLPDKVPMAYLGIAKSVDGVELINKAGDTLTSSSVTILVDGIDRTSEFRTQENTPGWGTLKAGERIHYTSPVKPESIQIVYASNSGRYLLASSESTTYTPIKIGSTQTTPSQAMQVASPPTQVTATATVDAIFLSSTIPLTMNSSQKYPVSVTMKNTGSMTWDEASQIRLGAVGDTSGDSYKCGSTRIQIPGGTRVLPGEKYTFVFTMTAPATPGTYHPDYQMVWSGHYWFGSKATRTLEVVSNPTVNAQVISSTIPSSMNAGQKYSVSVTMKNTGSMTWNETSQIRFGGVGDTKGDAAKFSPIRIQIPAGTSILPGEKYTSTFTMTAPAKPGAYRPEYQMVWSGHYWFGARASRTLEVVSTSAPVAKFTSDTMQGQSPLTVQFIDQSTGAAPLTYHWDFSDGEGNLPENSYQNPSWRFWEDVATSYTVTLTVTNAFGSDTIVKQNYIRLGDTLSPAPVAAFTSSVQSGTAPLTVQFTDQSTGTAPISYAWDFNNDRAIDSTAKNPAFTFVTDGDYTVNLTVTNADGKDTDIKTNYIRVTTPVITSVPVAQFTANTTGGTSPLTIQFTDKSVSTGTTSYKWDMNNDGIVDYTTKNPSHTYTTAGSYTVKLTVTNASGGDNEIKTNYITLSSLQAGDCYGAEACNPTGNPLGGGAGYTRIITEKDSRVKYVVSTRDQLVTALKNAKSGEVVFVKGSAVIDMTGTPNNVIPAGVIVASDRGNGGSQGALIKYTSNNNGRYGTSLFVAGGNNVRVTGLRLEGEMLPQDGTGNGEANYLVAISVRNKAGLEVDNCEIRGWAWSCVTSADSTGTYIHHNYLHHNQARGEGYGADIYGGDMLVEANIFNYNRHYIAAGGYPGESYEARYNLVRGDGHPIGSHHFDVHACNPNNYADDSETLSLIHI